MGDRRAARVFPEPWVFPSLFDKRRCAGRCLTRYADPKRGSALGAKQRPLARLLATVPVLARAKRFAFRELCADHTPVVVPARRLPGPRAGEARFPPRRGHRSRPVQAHRHEPDPFRGRDGAEHTGNIHLVKDYFQDPASGSEPVCPATVQVAPNGCHLYSPTQPLCSLLELQTSSMESRPITLASTMPPPIESSSLSDCCVIANGCSLLMYDAAERRGGRAARDPKLTSLGLSINQSWLKTADRFIR